MPKKYADLLSRAGWTLLQAAVGFGVTEAGSISAWWAVPLAALLSGLKTAVVNRGQ